MQEFFRSTLAYASRIAVAASPVSVIGRSSGEKMNGRSLNWTPSPLMSPLTSGVYGRPLWTRHMVARLKPSGSCVKPERMNVWSRAKSLRPHAPSSSPAPPISFGPNLPTFGFENPDDAVQQEYDELSNARVYVYEPRSVVFSSRR